MSFLDKLKVKVEEKTDEEIKDGVIDKNSGFMQLEVDIFQTAEDIIIIAPIPGVEVADIDISIENENDVVTIQGKIEQPNLSEYADDDENSKYLRSECQWGRFYRQIILPQEINVSQVEAKFKKGILTLRLPLLLLQSQGKKKIAVNAG
ncbi:MAG: Hsp20/alpha crystallin family protein [Patescibacteria group bacterium]|nr:Hsp20/alpha crystallin family protein [Patescibacteria group bacterium]